MVHQEKDMPNIAAVLREEIVRLARKEIRTQTNVLRKASAQYRRDIGKMKRRISELQHKLTPLQKQVLRGVSSQPPEGDGEHVRFTAKGLRSQRQRMGLSAANYGKLIGVTGQTIYSWEGETSRPRKSQAAKIASLRHLAREGLGSSGAVDGWRQKKIEIASFLCVGDGALC
jgi:DNA-binding XRE family transcriptional regulator